MWTGHSSMHAKPHMPPEISAFVLTTPRENFQRLAAIEQQVNMLQQSSCSAFPAPLSEADLPRPPLAQP